MDRFENEQRGFDARSALGRDSRAITRTSIEGGGGDERNIEEWIFVERFDTREGPGEPFGLLPYGGESRNASRESQGSRLFRSIRRGSVDRVPAFPRDSFARVSLVRERGSTLVRFFSPIDTRPARRALSPVEIPVSLRSLGISDSRVRVATVIHVYAYIRLLAIVVHGRATFARYSCTRKRTYARTVVLVTLRAYLLRIGFLRP